VKAPDREFAFAVVMIGGDKLLCEARGPFPAFFAALGEGFDGGAVVAFTADSRAWLQGTRFVIPTSSICYLVVEPEVDA
jgi:hypothetical protein